MTTLNDLQRRLGFTYAALTQDQDTFTVYLDQYAMHGNTRSQFHIEVFDQRTHEFTGGLTGPKYRDLRLLCHSDQFIVRHMVTCQDQTRDILVKQSRQPFFPLFRCQFIQISMLHISDQLDTVRTEMVVVAGQLQTRTGHVRHVDTDFFHIIRGIYDFKFKGFNDLCQKNTGIRHTVLLRQ